MQLLPFSPNSIQSLSKWGHHNRADLLLLVTGVLLGYGSLVHILGTRPIVILSGGVIMVGTIAIWAMSHLRQQRRHHQRDRAHRQTNLLDWPTFQHCLKPLAQHVPPNAQNQWLIAEMQIQASHHMCQQIAQQEPTFLADLLETLHTILSLAEQFAHACEVTDRVQTARYQSLAQEQLTNSQTRLSQTHDQLQQLHDQLAVASLERSQSHDLSIAERLQVIIAANENAIVEESTS